MYCIALHMDLTRTVAQKWFIEIQRIERKSEKHTNDDEEEEDDKVYDDEKKKIGFSTYITRTTLARLCNKSISVDFSKTKKNVKNCYDTDYALWIYSKYLQIPKIGW